MYATTQRNKITSSRKEMAVSEFRVGRFSSPTAVQTWSMQEQVLREKGQQNQTNPQDRRDLRDRGRGAIRESPVRRRIRWIDMKPSRNTGLNNPHSQCGCGQDRRHMTPTSSLPLTLSDLLENFLSGLVLRLEHCTSSRRSEHCTNLSTVYPFPSSPNSMLILGDYLCASPRMIHPRIQKNKSIREFWLDCGTHFYIH